MGADTDRTADPINVLFVDDDRQWARLVAEDIEAEADAITVTVAGSATECLEIFRDRDDIDCILADYQMPGTDGLELLEQIREEYPRLPFLLVTSQGSERVAARATDAGVTDYLIKTVGGEQAPQFVTKIERAVAHYRLQRAIEESEQRYRTVTEQSRDGIAIVQNGQLRFCNERLIELTGRERPTLQDGDVVAEVVHREDRDQVRTVVDSWLEGDELSPLHETRIVRPSGTVRHCEFTGGRIDYGGGAAVLLSIRDVTERNRRERELQWERELNRTIQKALVESRTRETLERTVTDQLQRHGYALAWIGERAGSKLVPRVVGGDRRYVDAIDLSLDDGRPDGKPSLEAIRTGDPQFQQRLGDRPSEWCAIATGHNYRSGGAIPLVYNEVSYGALTVYHGQPDHFDETERRLLTELADTVAFAIHSLETQDALAADQAVDVSLQVEAGYYLLDLARDGAFAECEAVQVVGTVPIDDAVVQYVDVDGASVLTLKDRVARHPDVRDATGIGDDPRRLQVTVTGPSPEARLASRGVIVDETTVEDGQAILDIELPTKADVRSTVNTLDGQFGTVSVRSVREHDPQSGDSDRGSGTEMGALTEKQLAALKAAYYNGYFTRPRGSSASDVADTLGVTHSTFLRHLRSAQEKLFGEQFE